MFLVKMSSVFRIMHPVKRESGHTCFHEWKITSVHAGKYKREGTSVRLYPLSFYQNEIS